MLNIDLNGILAKTIGTSAGIVDQDTVALHTPIKRYVGEWLDERKNGQHTWSMDPYNKKLAEKVKEVAKKAKAMKIQTVVWIGIGGSGLGPKVIQEAFESPKTVEFIVVDTIDPSALKFYLEILDWKSTLVVVVSKSGETLETMSAFFLFWQKLRQTRSIKPSERVIGITDAKKGELRAFCIEHDIEMLPITRDTGGRFCIFTPVGLLAMALLDQEVNEFLRGAKDMDTLCQNLTADENPAAQLAMAQFLLETKRGYIIRVIMPYAPAAHRGEPGQEGDGQPHPRGGHRHAGSALAPAAVAGGSAQGVAPVHPRNRKTRARRSARRGPGLRVHRG